MVIKTLDVYMNGYLVGHFTKTGTGAHQFQYHQAWLDLPGSRPISLSMPLRHERYQGDEVYNFFDNLLPDNPKIREKIVARHKAISMQPFDLLEKIGKDSVGALQLLPAGSPATDIRRIEKKRLSPARLEKIITGYLSDVPLGMIEEEQDFRISLAGAQEKTALLNIDGQWYLPVNATPTTHIIKLPIGKIQSHSFTIDMSESGENEYICMLICRAFELAVADCFLMQPGELKALAVERFDRKYSADKSWIMRLPQEDFCQAMGVPSARKYETHGGPGIKAIMDYLLGSARAEHDRYTFMKTQVLFWLLAATDGHAKNFSVYIGPGGSYWLTPLYDILSMYPIFGGNSLNKRDAKLAMGLSGSRGKKYQVEQIFPRHFFQTAKEVGFSAHLMEEILAYFDQQMESAIASVSRQLPLDFPAHIRDKIFTGMRTKSRRLRAGR